MDDCKLALRFGQKVSRAISGSVRSKMKKRSQGLHPAKRVWTLVTGMLLQDPKSWLRRRQKRGATNEKLGLASEGVYGKEQKAQGDSECDAISAALKVIKCGRTWQGL